MLQISTNASAFSIHLRLMYVHSVDDAMFCELLHEPEIDHPVNSRILNRDAMFALFSTARGTQEQRIERAAVQYELALRRFNTWERPIALAHLYMGAEALTKAMIRYECDRLAISVSALALRFGVDAADEKVKHKLEAAARRDLIFKGDTNTYSAIRKASDGIEHGFANWEAMWGVPEEDFYKTAAYLRDAILRAFQLPNEAYNLLSKDPFLSFEEQGSPIAFQAMAPISSIDLRARDFKTANVRRVLVALIFNKERGEYSFRYTISAA